jgi:hypothetical protein
VSVAVTRVALYCFDAPAGTGGSPASRHVRALLELTSVERSETARRLKSLFKDPKPVEHVGIFLEDGLIHRTARGELVRSKSEVIIANLLHALDIAYAYEQPFVGREGTVRYPDFTIEDAETGQRVFLEHWA